MCVCTYIYMHIYKLGPTLNVLSLASLSHTFIIITNIPYRCITFACKCVYVCVCTYVDAYVHMHVHIIGGCVVMCVDICVYMHVCECIFVYVDALYISI